MRKKNEKNQMKFLVYNTPAAKMSVFKIDSHTEHNASHSLSWLSKEIM